jgi:hypothetical protein
VVCRLQDVFSFGVVLWELWTLVRCASVSDAAWWPVMALALGFCSPAVCPCCAVALRASRHPPRPVLLPPLAQREPFDNVNPHALLHLMSTSTETVRPAMPGVWGGGGEFACCVAAPVGARRVPIAQPAPPTTLPPNKQKQAHPSLRARQ